MMIRCPKCGFENQLGAIFCRNCGDKLNIEEIRPKVVDSSPRFSFFSILYKILVLIILFGLIGILVAMFIPADQSSYPTLGEESAQKNARFKTKKLIERVNEGFGESRYIFSPEEATFVFNDAFISQSEGRAGKGYVIEKVAFKIDSMGFVNILLQTKLGGKIPASFEVKGVIVNPLEDAKDGEVSFKVVECKMGKMPIKFFEKQLIDKFRPTIEIQQINKILKKIKSIEINEQRQFVINIK